MLLSVAAFASFAILASMRAPLNLERLLLTLSSAQAQLGHQLLSRALVSQQRLDLLSECRDISQRPLERGQRGSKLQQLFQLWNLIHHALGRKIRQILAFELDRQARILFAGQLVIDLNRER